MSHQSYLTAQRVPDALVDGVRLGFLAKAMTPAGYREPDITLVETSLDRYANFWRMKVKMTDARHRHVDIGFDIGLDIGDGDLFVSQARRYGRELAEQQLD